ncbi:MAG: hypothetical protein MUD17_09085 [Gemmatimonadaceae bacterium]|nr:hypothetical protein [Gemmatimonadaceae bacterium]
MMSWHCERSLTEPSVAAELRRVGGRGRTRAAACLHEAVEHRAHLARRHDHLCTRLRIAHDDRAACARLLDLSRLRRLVGVGETVTRRLLEAGEDVRIPYHRRLRRIGQRHLDDLDAQAR